MCNKTEPTPQSVATLYSINLHHLVCLALVLHNILSIERVRDLEHQMWLNLSGNNIKTIEHSHANVLLEYTALEENSRLNLSSLTMLKLLNLHKNHIGTLRHYELYLLPSLVIHNPETI